MTNEEVEQLLNDVWEVYGYDFSQYSKASIKRRIVRLYSLDKYPSFAEFRYRLRNDKDYLQRFVSEVTVNVTEMFRDPSFFIALRQEIFPELSKFPLIRIWIAGCSTGEEVFSISIILKELGLLDKALIYATDINPFVLEKAKTGIFQLKDMKLYSENYIHSGGSEDFSSYYNTRYDHAKFQKELSSKVIFSTHNLVSDRSFNVFHLIICRNVMIYFDKELQNRVLSLFDGSMEKQGYLALGSKESLRFSIVSSKYEQFGKEKVWRKIE